MKKNLTSSYEKKRLNNLPQIHTSSVNLSINNTIVLIRNNTQDNLTFNQSNTLPKIIVNNLKKQKTMFTPLKLARTKNINNIHTISLKKENTQKTENTYKTENELNSNFELMMSDKILGKLLYFFNVRELLNLMNINKKINTFIKSTEIFKKYINIKKDLDNGNLFKDIKDDKIFKINQYNLKNNSRNISYKLSIQSKFSNKINTSSKIQNINRFLKFNLVTKKRLKLNKIINHKKVINQFFKNYEKNNLKLDTIGSGFETSRNSVLSNKTGSSKTKDKTKDNITKNNLHEIFNIKDINMKKIKIMIFSLIKNNGYKISLLMKKYKLDFISSKQILNGIFESMILKIKKENNQLNNFDSIILERLNPDKFLELYIDPLLNLDFFKFNKIHFNNVYISSSLLMKKISSLINMNIDNIKILSLQNNNIDDNYAKILFKSIKNNQNLIVLNLDHNQISSRGIKYIETFLIKNNTLNTLVLSYNYLSTSGSNLLFSFLKENINTNLRTLDISYNGIGEGGIDSLVNYIKTNKKLISLFLSGNYLCDKGLHKFSNSLFINNKDNKTVRLSYLDISNNSFTKNCFIYINNIIYFSLFISSINISYNSLCFEGISNIFSCINKQSKLVSLDLSKTNLDEKSIEFISKKLDKSIALRILNLSHNNLNKACKHIQNLLKKESNLKILKLISCQISQESNLIFQGLSLNNGLQTFDISSNYLYIEDDLLIDLYSFFKNNTKLNNLIMDNNNIDDILMNYISKFIEENKHLKFISFKNNKFSNQGAVSLLNSLQKNENIRKIDLEGNIIDIDIKRQIYKFLNEKLNINKNVL